METVLAVVVGGLTRRGIYLMLRRSLVKLLFGLALLSHAPTLIFTAAGFTGKSPPLVPMGAVRCRALRGSSPAGADPDRIVISFAVLAFGPRCSCAPIPKSARTTWTR
jgi:multicomponent Na+:H+ antiporter subunit C